MSNNPFRRRDKSPYGSSPGAGGGDDDFAPPPGPPPSHHRHRYEEDEDFAPPPGPPPSHHFDDFAPPPGPPPGKRRDDYAPPPGPPPGQRHQDRGYDDFAPPPGPPPSKSYGRREEEDFAPPPGPPPPPNYAGTSHSPAGTAADDWMKPPPGPPSPLSSGGHYQPQHNWEDAVPDTSLFPPPPAIFSGYDSSPAANATEQQAEEGERWCAQHPLSRPMTLDAQGKQALEASNLTLIEPHGLRGKLTWRGTGVWEGQTTKDTPDSCIIAYPPLYVVSEHDPTRFGETKTIYYEVKLRDDTRTNFIALGFTALPYPSFRMPGWHRGSLAVHGDDGHKYINDRWGGKAFTEELQRGDTYGIGMNLRPPTPSQGGPQPQVDIFFTRNGRHLGGWDLHEETDAEEDLPVTGLEGYHDLSCAIGVYDCVSFDVMFDPRRWLYRPWDRQGQEGGLDDIEKRTQNLSVQ